MLLTADILDYMYAHAQRRLWRKEAGGEVYAVDPHAHSLIITTATGPNLGDRRARHFFNPDVEVATRDRERQFAKGLHAVGLWHTHPEARPAPSGRDRRTTEEYMEAFRGDRDGYLMLILGNRGNPPNLVVWSAGKSDGSRWIELIEAHERVVGS